jgi:small subunit ribosomal protein S9
LLDESSQQFASVAVGRRKTASARVMITPGKGDVFLNGRPLIDFVASYRLRDFCLRPLIVTETLGRFDVHAQTRGGGTSGQIGAVTHGLARALQNWDPDWRLVLKREKLLMRDERMVERKKTGQPKARKEWQWSKR